MAIKRVECYIVYCDVCSYPAVDADGSDSHYVTEADALEAIKEWGWRVQDGIIRCGDCIELSRED